MRTVLLLTLIAAIITTPVAAEIIITEVFYDYAGDDDGYEWIEILNTSESPFDLDGYQLANGGLDYSFSTAMLAGTVDACATFVIGSLSSADNGSPMIDLLVNFDPDLQNAGVTADGVALFAPGDDPATACPIDAVIYGETNDNELLDQTCAPGAVDVGDAAAGQSIERTSLAGDWIIQSAPAPNQVAFDYDCEVVAAEPVSWSAVKSLYR